MVADKAQTTIPNDNQGDEVKPPANDNRARFVDEFLSSRPGTVSDKAAAGADSGAVIQPAVDAETVNRNLSALDQTLRANGVESAQLRAVRERFAQKQVDGSLPTDLAPINDIVKALAQKGADGALPTQTRDVMLRLISANLDEKVDLITPQNFKQKTDRPIFNRENLQYGEADINCRACTASYIVNESLSERALMREFDKLLEKVELGKGAASRLNVPLENGLPRMTATLFQKLHGDAFEGIAGEKYSQKEVRDFHSQYKTVQKYIENGLQQSGFKGSNLPGGDLKPGKWPPKEPGFYVLEHGSSNTSGQVSGHVTAAFVDKDLQIHRIDAQNPNHRTREWPITQMYKLELGEESSERIGNKIDGSKTYEVTNSDSTIRDITISDGKAIGFTDVDGREFNRTVEGKWQSVGGKVAEAPFKDVEYLGRTGGFKFTYENYSVTELPDGTAKLDVQNRAIVRDGKPIIANGQEVKLADVIDSIKRTAQGRILIEFKDKSVSMVDPPDAKQPPGEVSKVGVTEKTLFFLDGTSGTTNGGSLDSLIVSKINAEVERGSTLEAAVSKLTSPGVDDAVAERRSRIAKEAQQAKLPSDPTSLAAYDRVLSELNLTEGDIKKAGEIVERSRKHLEAGVLVDKKPVDARQALDLAILENMPDPLKGDGKNMRLASAQKKLREFGEFRSDLNLLRVPEPTLRNFLQSQELIDRYSGQLISAFDQNRPTSKSSARSRDSRIAYNFVSNPEQLKAAEELLPKLKQTGGDRIGLADAFAMVNVPGLSENPELAVDLHIRSGYIRNQLSNYRGSNGRQSWSAQDYLKLAKILKDDGKSATANITEIEKAERKLVEDERQAKAEAEKTGQAVEVKDATAKSDSSQATPTRQSAPSEPPLEASRIMMFKSKIAGLEDMPAGERLAKCLSAAQETLFNDVARNNRLIFKATKLQASETDALKPGESQLTFSKNGKPLNVVSLDSTGLPAYITADGTKIPVSECTVEIKVGNGSSAQQVASEALVRVNAFREALNGNKPEEAARQATAESARRLFQETRGPTVEGSGTRVAERVIPIGAHEFKSSRIEVSLSESGVKFGGDKLLPYDQLVRDTLQDKVNHRDRLVADENTAKKAEVAEQIKILNEQIVDLQHLRDNLHRPGTTTRLMETIGKHATPAEIEKLRVEIAAGRGGALKGTVARAGAYAIVAGFVTNMLANGQTGSNDTIKYATTSSR